MKYAILGSLLILSSACNPLDSGDHRSFKGDDFNPGLSTASPTATPAPVLKSLDLSWTPHFADLHLYLKHAGIAATPIADNEAIAGEGGLSGVMHNTGASYVSAPTNSGIQFSGQGIELTGTDQNLPFVGQDFTVMTWMKTSTTQNWGRIISNGVYNWYNGFVIQMGSDMGCGHAYPGHFFFGLGAYGGVMADGALYQTTAAYNDGAWHHIAMKVEQAANKKITFYVDGVSVPIEKIHSYDTGGSCAVLNDSCGTISGNTADFTGCTNATSSNAWGTTWVGSVQFNWNDFFDGSLSETAVFQGALSGSEISQIFNRQK